MTTRAQLVEKIRERVAAGAWIGLGRDTVRWSRQRTTPDACRAPGSRGGPALWPDPVYTQFVFLSVVGRNVILGTAAAPWTNRVDQEVPLWLAELIVEDPPLALDTQRRLTLAAERAKTRTR